MFFYPVSPAVFFWGILALAAVCAAVWMKRKAGRAWRKAAREAARLPTEDEIVVVTEYGVWHDAWFTPSRKLTRPEFRRAVRRHEEAVRHHLGPSYRYRGPVRLDPD